MQQLIKKSYVILSLVVVSLLGYQTCQQTDLYQDIHFDTCLSRKLFLNEYAYKIIEAIENNHKDKDKYLVLYFRAFPRDFKTFFQMTHDWDGGFDGDTFYSTYISYIYSHNPWSKFNIIQKEVKSEEEIPREKLSKQNIKDFDRILSMYEKWEEYEAKEEVKSMTPYTMDLKLDHVHNRYHMYNILDKVQEVIPEEIFYEKILTLGINGFWDADDVGMMQMCMLHIVFNKTLLVTKILNKKTDDEIASFWFFLFDGPHPDNYQGNYEDLYEFLLIDNPRLAQLLKKAYTQLLSDRHCEGH